MELKHKVFVGINTLEELALDRSNYFEKESSTKAEAFEKFLESYDPRTDGQELFQSALEANILVTAGGICL
jgi:hypothetical protein